MNRDFVSSWFIQVGKTKNATRKALMSVKRKFVSTPIFDFFFFRWLLASLPELGSLCILQSARSSDHSFIGQAQVEILGNSIKLNGSRTAHFFLNTVVIHIRVLVCVRVSFVFRSGFL